MTGGGPHDRLSFAQRESTQQDGSCFFHALVSFDGRATRSAWTVNRLRSMISLPVGEPQEHHIVELLALLDLQLRILPVQVGDGTPRFLFDQQCMLGSAEAPCLVLVHYRDGAHGLHFDAVELQDTLTRMTLAEVRPLATSAHITPKRHWKTLHLVALLRAHAGVSLHAHGYAAGRFALEDPAAPAPAPVLSSAKSIRIAQWNVCGFRTRKEQCQNLAKDYALDVLCLQESGLKPSHEAKLPGYVTAVRQDRLERKGGGLLVFVKSNIVHEVTLLTNSEEIHSAIVTLQFAHCTFRLATS
eukprot:6491158-Amphidinium_carterae.1